ncbi:hypothetical protein [Chitinibacter tainanensis]|uniref:hypothetical protein n=1 Tax=Chitinibacter tainanensis TaxID=230667 RepID=UPI002353E351|nr:hypothetical protein [Chitinibacter tainanensis]
MRITDSQLQLSAQRQFSQQRSEKLSLQYQPPRPSTPASSTVDISAPARVQEELQAAIDNDPRLKLIRSLLEIMLGESITLTEYHPKDQSKPSTDSNTPTTLDEGGFILHYAAEEQEQESTQYAASGTIETSDGMHISFSAELSLSRQFQRSVTLDVATGSAARPKKDPLVLNYAAPAATLSPQTFQFDLDQDGRRENISLLNHGSAYLALDRNQDGKINHGGELFGAKSGNGFADLAQFDQDRNGWIDEDDAVFGELKLWLKDASGNDQLQSLAQAQIGALYLGYAKADFDLNDGQNRNLGQLRASGIYLRENGQAGSLQQLDLSV